MSGGLLRIAGLRKSFAVPVLRGIELSLVRGEIRGLIGENGAGKSTLINILAGVLGKDDGDIWLNGKLHAPVRPVEAQRAGVSLASQELSLQDTLDIGENLFLGHFPKRGGTIDRRALDEAARHILCEIGLDGLSPDGPVAGLSMAQKQLLEFGKALARPCDLLILDEPTAALTGPQADRLHAIMARRAAAGTAILYVSHRLDDIRRVCGAVSVLRDGEVIATKPASELDVGAMIELMSGRQPERSRARRAGIACDVALAARGLTTARLPYPIDIDIRKGEILGIAGLAGAGRSELLEALYGLDRARTGSVLRIEEDRVRPIVDACAATAAGIGLVSEDRKHAGIFAGLPLSFNMTIADLGRISPFGVVNQAQEADSARVFAERLHIRCSGLEQDISLLSGGNQQKALLARWMIGGTAVLLLDEPTRGVDVGSSAEIHDEIRRLAAAGCGVAVVSSDMDELTALADRIVVLSGKRLVAEFASPPWSRAEILNEAFRHHVGEREAHPQQEDRS